MQQQCGGAASRLRLSDLNSHLVCLLCRGYLVDATTIVECLHSFCRSCLVRHLERGVASCPSCEAPLPRARPFLHIRSDKTLQDIVYKLVPGLYGAEMQRRRHFFAKHPEHASLASAEERGVAMERLVFSPEDQFSLSLEYLTTQQSELNLRGDDWECASSRSSESGLEGGATGEVAGGPARRFLQCPALFTVGLIKKFVRMKFELGPAHRVDVMHRRVCLPDDYTVMDVAYIYSWRQGSPMRFFYRICREDESPSAKKRAASEPAVTEAPPAKLERIAEEEPTEVSKIDKVEVTHHDRVTQGANSTPKSAVSTPISVPPLTGISSTPINVPPTPITAVTPTPTNVTSSSTSTGVQSVTLSLATLSTKSTTPTPAPLPKVTPLPLNVTNPTAVNTSPRSMTPVPRSETPESTPTVALPSPPSSQAMDLSPPVPTSPSKTSRPRQVSGGRGGQSSPSILSIAQNLARKQQARQQQEQQGSSPGSSPQQSPEIQNKPHEVQNKPHESKDKYKPIQPRPPPAEIRPSPTTPQQQQLQQQQQQQLQQQQQIQQQQLQQQQQQYYQKLQQTSQKRSHTTSQQKLPQINNVNLQQQVPVSDNKQSSTVKVFKDDIKKPKHEDILRQTLSKSHSKSPSKQSAARTRPSPTYINTPSPFSPMHRPAPHPLRIPAPPKQQPRPSSLSSSSSPSPSPPAEGSPRGHHHLQFSENAAAAAAMMVRQQLELQSRLHMHGATQMEWPLHPHSFLPPAEWLHAGSAESMKRLEDLMRSLGRGAPMFPYRPVGPNPAATAAAANAAAHAQNGAK